MDSEGDRIKNKIINCRPVAFESLTMRDLAFCDSLGVEVRQLPIVMSNDVGSYSLGGAFGASSIGYSK